MIDTALLIAGALTARMYFNADTARGSRAARNRRSRCIGASTGAGRRMAAGRSCKAGSRSADSCITAGRATARRSCCTCWRSARRRTRSSRDSYEAWTATYQWENLYGVRFPVCRAAVHAPVLACVDRFSRHPGSLHAREALRLFREQPARDRMSSANTRGATRTSSPAMTKTAGDSPHAMARATRCRSRSATGAGLFGYAARGVPYGPDDGTLAGWAALASLPFAPDIALCRRAQHASALSARCCADHRYASGFNPALDRRRRRRLGFGRPLTGSTRASWS